MSRFVRPPTSDIQLWDSLAGEVACTAQLLYTQGLIDVQDVRGLDARIGRRSDDVDYTFGHLRVLLEEGFHIHSVGMFDTKKAVGPKGMDYIAWVWVNKLDRSEEETRKFLPGMYPDIKRRLLHLVALQEQYPRQYVNLLEEPSFQRFTELLGKGMVSVSLNIPDTGTNRTVLVSEKLPDGQYQIYDPSFGVGPAPLERIFEGLMTGFKGIFMPR